MEKKLEFVRNGKTLCLYYLLLVTIISITIGCIVYDAIYDSSKMNTICIFCGVFTGMLLRSFRKHHRSVVFDEKGVTIYKKGVIEDSIAWDDIDRINISQGNEFVEIQPKSDRRFMNISTSLLYFHSTANYRKINELCGREVIDVQTERKWIIFYWIGGVLYLSFVVYIVITAFL